MKSFIGVNRPMICILDTEEGGKADTAVYSNRTWAIFGLSNDGSTVAANGGRGWIRAPVNFFGDRKTEGAVYRIMMIEESATQTKKRGRHL